MTQRTRQPQQFPDSIRFNWGYRDALIARTWGKFPMPLFQQTWPVHQRTYDVETVAHRHFDRAYAKGYVKGWLAGA